MSRTYCENQSLNLDTQMVNTNVYRWKVDDWINDFSDDFLHQGFWELPIVIFVGKYGLTFWSIVLIYQ